MGMTPTQEASYALTYNLGRDGLSAAGQLEYDRTSRRTYRGSQGKPLSCQLCVPGPA